MPKRDTAICLLAALALWLPIAWFILFGIRWIVP